MRAVIVAIFLMLLGITSAAAQGGCTKDGTAFVNAVKADDLATIKCQVAAGIDPRKSDYGDEESALHLAADKCAPKATLYLLAEGADPDRRNKWNDTPISIATARCGALSMVALTMVASSKASKTKPVSFSSDHPVNEHVAWCFNGGTDNTIFQQPQVGTCPAFAAGAVVSGLTLGPAAAAAVLNSRQNDWAKLAENMSCLPDDSSKASAIGLILACQCHNSGVQKLVLDNRDQTLAFLRKHRGC